jgi:bacterioferritin-associated ferredoxin
LSLENEIDFQFHLEPRPAPEPPLFVMTPCPVLTAPVCGATDMTRCECAEVSFAEIARRVRAEGWSLDEIAARTGCGGTCTACVPDLVQYLAARAAY